jgi:hypothetical protein
VLLRLNCEQSWRDFAGWRVNYDRVLMSLAGHPGAAPVVVVGPSCAGPIQGWERR